MTTPRFEHFLAQLYVDENVRRRFLADALGTASAAGLAPAEIEALAAIDMTGLELASRSFALKRESHAPGGRGRFATVAAVLRALRFWR